MISRRKLLTALGQTGSFLGVSTAFAHPLLEAFIPALGRIGSFDRTEDLIRTAPVARYWISTGSPDVNCLSCHKQDEKLAGKGHQTPIVKCLLCAQGCMIAEGQRGKCRARMNVKGELRSLVYGRPVTIHVDPLEKKPFYHFLPGSEAFSLATSGCPLHCKFCQNWEISQSSPEDFNSEIIQPERIVNSVSAGKSPVIAFTYNEPTVFMEYMADIAQAARKQKIRCVLVSCGFMKEDPLKEMCRLLDAIKIDLKGFSPDFYRNVCSAELRPVLNSIKQIKKSGVHLEIVNLVVPTLNDSEKMFQDLTAWIAGELGPDVPIHFTRFHPDYQLLNLPPTPVASLERARDLAMSKGIHYAYVGNVPGHAGNNTYCPNCSRTIIKRNSFFIMENNVKQGRCGFCGKAIAGVWL
jgi:pyruvate formate lyase activating enzyme